MLSRLIDRLFAAFFGTVQRMLFGELVRVFALCLFALSGIFTLLAVLQQLQFGASLGQVARMLPLLIPISVPWIVPPACLFATCVVYGRLAADNEILAIKAAGINLLHVTWPAIFLGIVTSAATVYLYLDIIPETHHQLRTKFLQDIEELLYGMLRRDGVIRHPKLSFPRGDGLEV